MTFKRSPDCTESSADVEERDSNRGSSPVEKIPQTSSYALSQIIIIIVDVPSDEGDTDQDGGEKVGQLEVELEP